jgi:hypothetical protein
MSEPNLFIIGFPKSGTTALATYLSAHPQVFFSNPKEPTYWATDVRNRHGDTLADCGFKSYDDYLDLFRDAAPEHKVVGEGSTAYIWSAEAIPRIQARFPESRIIVMIRNPVQMAYSLHGEMLAELNEDVEDFATAWRLQEARRRGESLPRYCYVPAALQYGNICRVATHMRRLLQIVDRERVHVVLFDDFSADTRQAYHGALEFLGLRRHRVEFRRVNESQRIRWPWLARAIALPTVLPKRLRFIERGLRAASHAVGLRSLRERTVKKLCRPAPRRPLPEQTRLMLIDEFRDEISELSDLIGRRLDHWLC